MRSNVIYQFQDIYFNNSGNKLQVTFNQLMKKMPNQYIESNNLDPFQKVLVQSLVDCLERDDSCNATWRQLFVRCSKQSGTLLSYIGMCVLHLRRNCFIQGVSRECQAVARSLQNLRNPNDPHVYYPIFSDILVILDFRV